MAIIIKFCVILLIWITSHQVEATLSEQLNYFVNQNRFTIQPSSFQAQFSLDDVISASLDLAMQSCQSDFKWERWNCPNTDFLHRHSSNRYQFDREDAYVAAIMTAAELYTITKDCSKCVISGCGCDNSVSNSDNLDKAEILYTGYGQQNIGNDFRGLMIQHNFKAISTLLRQSIIRQCSCSNNACSEKNCIDVLKPFSEIARNIKIMYDDALQLTTGVNTQIMWSNIPLDSLVYAADSPNYCDLDAVPQWPGMHGRQCVETSNENNESENASSCQQLCYECGYRVRTRNVIIEHNCNCKFTWNFQMQCERCKKVEQQFYCF